MWVDLLISAPITLVLLVRRACISAAPWLMTVLFASPVVDARAGRTLDQAPLFPPVIDPIDLLPANNGDVRAVLLSGFPAPLVDRAGVWKSVPVSGIVRRS